MIATVKHIQYRYIRSYYACELLHLNQSKAYIYSVYFTSCNNNLNDSCSTLTYIGSWGSDMLKHAVVALALEMFLSLQGYALV